MSMVHVPHEATQAVCELYSFPFMVLVDSSQEIAPRTIKVDETYIRFYPLFRSGDANYVPMPAIRTRCIPFRRGYEPEQLPPESERLPVLSVIPGLTASGADGVSTHTQLVFGPSWDDIPIHFPADSLRLDVYVQNEDPPANTEAIVRSFLAHLRENSRQWWILRSFDTILGWQRNSWGIDRQGRLKTRQPPGIHAQGSLGMLGDELPVTDAIWQKSLDSVVRQEEACLYRQFLFDGRCSLASRDYASCAFNLATACDLAVVQCAEILWKRKTGKSRGALEGNDLVKKLDRQFKRQFDISFKDDHGDLFEIITALWDVRGQVAHGKSAHYHVDHGREVHMDHERAFAMLEASVGCIAWLEKKKLELR